jgi:hypothetical protein
MFVSTVWAGGFAGCLSVSVGHNSQFHSGSVVFSNRSKMWGRVPGRNIFHRASVRGGHLPRESVRIVRREHHVCYGNLPKIIQAPGTFGSVAFVTQWNGQNCDKSKNGEEDKQLDERESRAIVPRMRPLHRPHIHRMARIVEKPLKTVSLEGNGIHPTEVGC